MAKTTDKAPAPVLDDIHGNTYEPVVSRLARFRFDHPSRAIQTSIISNESGLVLMRAVIKDDNQEVYATGHAEEDRSAGHINQTSAVENCETSAIGRALAFAGYDASGNIASSDEVTNAKAAQAAGGGARAQAPARNTASSSPATPAPNAAKAGDKSYTVTQVETKELNRKDGSGTFSKYVVHTGEGPKLSTLKKNLADIAMAAMNEGKELFASHQAQNQWGECNLMDCAVSNEPPAVAVATEIEEEMPF